MSRRKKPFPILEDIEIEATAAEGKSLARVNDMVVFVPFCVPGDVVDLQIKRKKHSYCEAEVVRFKSLSPVRQEPLCPHFGVCGGCKWQILPYEEQLRMKQSQVENQLRRIGKVELPEIEPILGSQKTTEYRNKLEFGCSNKRWLTKEEVQKDEDFTKERNAIGFHITGAFDKILPIERCVLMDERHNAVRNFIRDWALENQMTFFDLRAQKGLLRDMMFRSSNTGEWMLLVQFHFEEEGDEQLSMRLLAAVGEEFPYISSLLWVDNQKCNDTFGDLEIHVFKGNDYIMETMERLRFKVGAKSFYQTNTDQAFHLYSIARDFASLSGKELVYDLYTGTGTIANFVAKSARQVIGIEYVKEAIEDAKVNSRINGIDNTLFFAGDMKDVLNDEFITLHGRPDVIITDPPRAGMHADVVDTILRAAPKRIVYVSCNPATQARDLSLLDKDYKVTRVRSVDMFPHTPHVENVVRLDRREG